MHSNAGSEKDNYVRNNILGSIAEDYRNNSKKSFVVLLFYRVMNYCYVRKLRILLALLHILRYLAYLLLNIDAQISYEATIGNDIRLPHSAGGGCNLFLRNHRKSYYYLSSSNNWY